MEQVIKSDGGTDAKLLGFFAGLTILVFAIFGIFYLGSYLVGRSGGPDISVVQKGDSSGEFEKNKLIAGPESDVVVINDYVVRGYFLAIEGSGISIQVRDGQTVSARLNEDTIYMCQGRFVTSTKGTKVDSLSIFVDYSRVGAPDPAKFPKSQVGDEGKEKFLSKVQRGNPVLIQTKKDEGGYLEAEAVTLVTEEPCTL